MTVAIDANMSSAYKKKGIPLWVYPSHVESQLLYDRWHAQIRYELRDWFARVWSMAFAAGYRNVAPPRVNKTDVQRQLSKMGYAPNKAESLADMLISGLPGLYKKGRQIAHLE